MRKLRIVCIMSFFGVAALADEEFKITFTPTMFYGVPSDVSAVSASFFTVDDNCTICTLVEDLGTITSQQGLMSFWIGGPVFCMLCFEPCMDPDPDSSSCLAALDEEAFSGANLMYDRATNILIGGGMSLALDDIIFNADGTYSTEDSENSFVGGLQRSGVFSVTPVPEPSSLICLFSVWVLLISILNHRSRCRAETVGSVVRTGSFDLFHAPSSFSKVFHSSLNEA
jgi:hypothetical protein